MDITNQENLITESRLEREKLLRTPISGEQSPFYTMSVGYGLLAGVLMGAFLTFGGFYITGGQAGIGFAKYILLAIALGVLLNKVKIASPEGTTFKEGLIFGFITTIVAAFTTALITLLVNGLGDTTVIQPYVSSATGAEIHSLVLAGIVFFESLVAGLILVFIWLQLLKDRKPAV